ncbi:phage major capsid protein [uncultured Pseudokineococcus sp.]|uniref:phage major capsid family protein n=1 Tax=uncultured Pseudokineococcus sp. TaxID=1642928 RepID=UPI00260BA96F|nr:phage major capsid protein [uncultured Pseudokineococcus sp.]
MHRIQQIKSRLGELGSKSTELTDAEVIEIETLADELHVEEKKDARSTRVKSFLDRVGKAPAVPGSQGGEEFGSGYSGGPGSQWAKSVTETMHSAAGAYGLKNLLQGQVDTPPAVEVSTLPTAPRRLLDLLPRELLGANTYAFLQQVAAQSNAAVVPDGEVKPTSVYAFREVEDRARVIAHLGEPFPLRYLSDYESMVQVLDSQMLGGVLSALEAQVVSGTGEGEDFTGLLNMSGVLDILYAGDPLTTLRRAVTVLQGKNENPTAWVLHPEDAERLQLTREEGTTGSFLFGSDFANSAVFGGVNRQVVSSAVPQGTALLADWSQFRLCIREDANTLAATQAGDLWQTNRVMLRTEGRYGFKALRPQAAAVVHLNSGATVVN